MTKEELLGQIEIILPKLSQWIQYKEASFLPEELNIVKQVIKVIQPGKVTNWACSACGGEVFNIIWSYYHREKGI